MELSKIMKKEPEETVKYFKSNEYSFPDIDYLKYNDTFSAICPLPKVFEKIIKDSFVKMGSIFNPYRYYGINGLEMTINPCKTISSEYYDLTPDHDPGTVEDYNGLLRAYKGALFLIYHFGELPKEITPLELILYKKERTKNKWFGKYKYVEVKREPITSNTTFVLPHGTYFKLNNANTTDGQKHKFQVLWSLCSV